MRRSPWHSPPWGSRTAEPVTKQQQDEWGPLARRTAIQRLAVAFLLGIGAGVAVSFFGPWALAVLTGWDAFAIVFLTWVWITVWPMDPDSTSRYAHRGD